MSFAFNVASGPRYRIGDVAIRPPTAQASLPAIDRAKLGLAPGDPADASAILEAQDKLITELRKEGYALASIKRDVVVNHATREATVTFVAETGPLARMGPVRFSGTDKVDTVWLQRRVPFKEGDPTIPPRSMPCAASSPRSACSTRCASSPRRRSTPTVSCRSMSN